MTIRKSEQCGPSVSASHNSMRQLSAQDVEQVSGAELDPYDPFLPPSPPPILGELPEFPDDHIYDA